MELKKCSAGHYYDGSIYSECPTCRNAQNRMGTPGGAGQGMNPTMPLSGGGSDYGRTMPLNGGMETQPVTDDFRTAPVSGGATMPLSGTTSVNREEGRTIGVVPQQMGMDPVTGWLVSISGSEKGRDYRIHSDNNFIGRGEKMDICIRGDETISRERHAVIAYDTREKIFYFAPGEGRSINRVNGKAVLGMVTLNPYDVIEIGCTKFLFIPLCGERFEWKDE